jgi:hypothetical protein
MIVLDEADVKPGGPEEFLLIEAFEEETSAVSEHPGLYD